MRFTWLVVGISTRLKHMSSSIGMIIPNMEKKVLNHQPVLISLGKECTSSCFVFVFFKQMLVYTREHKNSRIICVLLELLLSSVFFLDMYLYLHIRHYAGFSNMCIQVYMCTVYSLVMDHTFTVLIRIYSLVGLNKGTNARSSLTHAWNIVEQHRNSCIPSANGKRKHTKYHQMPSEKDCKHMQKLMYECVYTSSLLLLSEG